ncbi:helix-turn-helix transcriptional regulator [Desulfoplanes formicivorans]|uniref:Transcriptional regulator n=1 Tax=Desulfoplanes formicivorans TaxID=1592317 RepID=A0A194AJG8_9BACT|nr:helix-turn-helix domain-containing protein [Desulfoplanes formicivorans]GAU08889.1 transcriptional regulator [Desulfoplanes formicivorans]
MKKLLTVKDLAAIFKTSEASIRMSMYRKRWDCVPPPIEVGKRRYWRESQIEEWLNKKIEMANKKAFASHPRKKRGRPTKTDTIIQQNTPVM